MQDEALAKAFCIGGAVAILGILVVLIWRHKRIEIQTASDAKFPVRTITMPSITMTSSTLGSSTLGAGDVELAMSRPGTSDSERSDLDVWELRQHQRQQYILEHVISKVRYICI